MPYLKSLSALEELDLSDTKITSKGLSVLADLANLKHLNLTRTKLTAKDVAAPEKP